MDEQEELISHTIVIDDYMTLEWKIPKVITPLQLQAMSKRVNKLFNLSEVQIADEQTATNRKYGGHWTQPIKDKLKEMYDRGQKAIPISQVLYEMTNDIYFQKPQVVHQQINYLKKIGFLNGRNNGNVKQEPKKVPQEKKVRNKTGVHNVFSQEDIAQMIGIWVSGKKTAVEVRDAMKEKTAKAYSKKQIADKLYQLKKKGLIK